MQVAGSVTGERTPPSPDTMAPPRYTAPFWLPGGNLQTILPALIGRAPQPPMVRERWDSLGADGNPDGDFIDVDWIAGPDGSPRWNPAAPLVVLFHGLEGSSSSSYARAIMAAVDKRGWNGCVPHFRGCSGEINRLPRAYHSGDSAEIAWILERLSARAPARIHAAGVSLGGNALFKWAAERGEDAARSVAGIAAVCSPLDLAACGRALSAGFNMLYTRMFLATLKAKSARKLERFPGLYDAARLREARDLYEFDNLVTAPLHGFRDTDDYWARASAKPLLGGIRVPALALNARNDPFVPAASLPHRSAVSRWVLLEQPEHGGHVGFPSAGRRGVAIDWLPDRLIHFFETQT